MHLSNPMAQVVLQHVNTILVIGFGKGSGGPGSGHSANHKITVRGSIGALRAGPCNTRNLVPSNKGDPGCGWCGGNGRIAGVTASNSEMAK